MSKTIDPVDVKGAVKNGQLYAYIDYTYDGVAHIMLRDTDTYETVELGNNASKSHEKNDIIKELEWYLHIFELRLNTIENNEKLLAYNRGYLLGIKNALELIRNGVDCNE